MTDEYGEFWDDEEFWDNEERLRSILLESGHNYDLKELSRSEVTESESEIVHREVITKGLLVDQNRHKGAWLRHLPDESLPRPLQGVISGATEADYTYVGDRYFLVRLGDEIHGFNIGYDRQLIELATELDYFENTPITRVLVNKDKRLLLLESPWAYFAIAGMTRPNMDEEERVILSNRLADSQPFFSFKAPIHVDWSRLKGDKAQTFERLCESLLTRDLDIDRIVPIGKAHAADRGRDFEAHETSRFFGEKRTTKWLVQSKFAEASISPDSISGWVERVIEHKCDGFWLMTNNDLTPSLIDQFRGVEENPDYKFEVRFWQRSDFHVKLNVCSEVLKGDYFFEQSPGHGD